MLNNMCTSCIHGKDQGKLINSLKMVQTTTLNISSLRQEKMPSEVGVGIQLWRVTRKSRQTRIRFVNRSKLVPSPLIKFFCDLESSLPDTERETRLQSEISFVNVNIPYEKLTCPWFRNFYRVFRFSK